MLKHRQKIKPVVTAGRNFTWKLSMSVWSQLSRQPGAPSFKYRSITKSLGTVLGSFIPQGLSDHLQLAQPGQVCMRPSRPEVATFKGSAVRLGKHQSTTIVTARP